MKKLIAMVLVLCMILGLTACGSGSGTTQTTQAAAAATTAVTDSCFTVKIFHLQPLLLFTLVLQKSRWLAPSAFLW